MGIDDVNARLEQIGQLALSTMPTIRNSYELTLDVCERNVPGDLVECGVFAGSQVAAMALALQLRSSAKRVHLYDSFQGIPHAGPHDGDAFASLVGRARAGDTIRTSGVSSCPEHQVREYMTGWGIELERLVWHAGWFQDVLPAADQRPEAIAILRLDGDLYESTACCLRYLYPLVSSGGFCIVDDYALPGCLKAVDEYFGPRMPAVTPIAGGLGPVYWQVP